MRNIFVFGLAAVCAVLIAGNALATEKDGGGHDGGYDDGGGKETQKHCVVVHNKPHGYGGYGYGGYGQEQPPTYCVWIKEQPKKSGYGGYSSEPQYHDYYKVKKQMVYAYPGKYGKSPKYKKGYYDCWMFYANDFHKLKPGHGAYDGPYIPHDVLISYKTGYKLPVHIEHKDVHIHCTPDGMKYGQPPSGGYGH